MAKATSKPAHETIDFTQARKFWFACMESKTAQGMANFLNLPINTNYGGDYRSVDEAQKGRKRAEANLAAFLRAVADHWENGPS